ncbi:unnamed protein product, partial [Hapterophycus canaliculatus]
RGFEELRGVLAELVEEGSALGLTAAELFLQLDDSASVGIGSRELRNGLASLSVHLTETEVETVMTGAGCIGGSTGSDSLLALEGFLAMTQNPRGPWQRVPASAAPASSPPALEVHLQPPLAGADLAHDITRYNSGSGAAEDDHGCVTPDSLALRMSVSELLVDVDDNGGGGGAPGAAPSSTAVAHLEAFGRVAADVQAVLTSAISGGGTGRASDHGERGEGTSSKIASLRGRGSPTRNDSWTSGAPPAGGLSGSAMAARAGAARSTVGEYGSSTLMKKDDEEERDEQDEQRENESELEEGRGTAARAPANSRASAAAASQAGPVPRTGAITPPFGPARSPSEPLHPTRASRERLEAALEGLDLKERLLPTAGVRHDVDDKGGSHAASCPGVHKKSSDRIVEAPLPVEIVRGDAGTSRRRASSLGVQRRRPAKVGVARAPAPAADPAEFSFHRLRRVEVGGRAESKSRAGANESRQVAGVYERAARARHVYGRKSDGAEPGQWRRRLGEVVHLGEADRLKDAGGYDGGPEEAPEVIGRLRARVTELELKEQLLRCELEGARADLVSKDRRAAEEAQRDVDRFRERERTLQAKMGARLRAAEAEAAAIEKRMAVFKRASAAEAAAREKSSADYLRRRLKEAEVALEAKAARRVHLSKQQQQQQQQQHKQQQQGHSSGRQRQAWRRESTAVGGNGADSSGDGGGSGVDSGRSTGTRWAQRRASGRRPGMSSAVGGSEGG